MSDNLFVELYAAMNQQILDGPSQDRIDPSEFIQHPETGKPLVLYHGTNRPVEQFDHEPTRDAQAVWMTPNPKVASDFALFRSVWQGANVMPVHVRAPKLLTVEGGGRPIRKVERETKLDGMREQESIHDFARRTGHHGTLFRNVRDDVGPDIPPVDDVYAFYQGANIKSVTGNRGTFSRTDQRVNYNMADTLPADDTPQASTPVPPRQPDRTPTAMPGLSVKEPDPQRSWKLAEGHTFDPEVVRRLQARADHLGYQLHVRPMRFADGRTRHHLTVYQRAGTPLARNPKGEPQFYGADEAAPASTPSTPKPYADFKSSEELNRHLESEYADQLQFLHIMEPHGKSVHLSQIQVKPEARGQGVGSKIVRAIQEYATARDLPITLEAEAEPRKKAALDGFYKSHGFRQPGRTRDYSLPRHTHIWRPRFGMTDKYQQRDMLSSQTNTPDQYAAISQQPILWHGSPSGNLQGSANGLHVGTSEAAKQALHSRIGIPVEGTWDGTREYGKTLLAGQRRLRELDPRGYLLTGYNADAPEEDHYPTGKATYGDRTPVPHDAKPVLFPVKIVGPMTNTPQTAHSDNRANGLMRRSIASGKAQRGFYYRNEGEDTGSISAVVPSGAHIQRLDQPDQYAARHTPSSPGQIGLPFSNENPNEGTQGSLPRHEVTAALPPDVQQPAAPEASPVSAAPKPPSRKWEPITLENGRKAYRAPNGTVWTKAQAGGELSPVTGAHFAGGRLMPIHGLSQKQEPRPKPTAPQASEQAKPNEHAKDRQSRPVRQFSPEDLEEERQRREDQSKWDEINRGPLGRIDWFGEHPNQRALDRNVVSLKGWREFAEQAGPEAVSRIVQTLEPEVHQHIDQSIASTPPSSFSRQFDPAEQAAWEKQEIRRRADEDAQTLPGSKKHLRAAPDSYYARHLIQERLGQQPTVAGLHRIHQLLDRATTSPAQQLYHALFSACFDLDRYAKHKDQAGQRQLFGPAAHDVSHEPRDEAGQWTTGGAAPPAAEQHKPDLAAKVQAAYDKHAWEPTKVTAETRGDAGREGARRTRNSVHFEKPIVGPSGAALHSYDWRWMWEESPEHDDPIRVSNWEEAARNEQTGRDIVHHFHVSTPGSNTVDTVSLETAIKLLGFGNNLDGIGKVRNLAQAAMQLAQHQQAHERLLADATDKGKIGHDYRVQVSEDRLAALQDRVQNLTHEAEIAAKGESPDQHYRNLARRAEELATMFHQMPGYHDKGRGDNISEIAKQAATGRDEQQALYEQGRTLYHGLVRSLNRDAMGGQTPKTPILNATPGRLGTLPVEPWSKAKIRNWYFAKGKDAEQAVAAAEEWLKHHHPNHPEHPKHQELRDYSKDMRHGQNSEQANMNYRKTGRMLPHSYLAVGPDNRVVRIDGSDVTDTAYFEARGYRRISEPVPRPDDRSERDENGSYLYDKTRSIIKSNWAKIHPEVQVQYPELAPQPTPVRHHALASTMLREYYAQQFADRVVERYAEQQTRLFDDAGGSPRKEFDETKHQRAGGQFARKYPRVLSKEVQPALPGVDLPPSQRVVTRKTPVQNALGNQPAPGPAYPAGHTFYVAPGVSNGGAHERVPIKIHKIDDTHAHLGYGDAPELGYQDKGHVFAKVPLVALEQFVNDLQGRVNVPAGHHDPRVNMISSGQAKFLGKGDDGMAFDTGDHVVKVSTVVPFHWTNLHGNYTPAQAAKELRNQVALNNEMRRAGVPGLLPQDFFHHGAKGFATMPKLQIPERFEQRHIDQMRETLDAMHQRGYVLRDDVQAGLDKSGNAVMFDTGKARKLSELDPTAKWHKSEIQTDKDNLKRLATKHGLDNPWAKDDALEGYNDWDNRMMKITREAKEGKVTPQQAKIMLERGQKAWQRMLEQDPGQEPWWDIPHQENTELLQKIIRGEPQDLYVALWNASLGLDRYADSPGQQYLFPDRSRARPPILGGKPKETSEQAQAATQEAASHRAKMEQELDTPGPVVPTGAARMLPGQQEIEKTNRLLETLHRHEDRIREHRDHERAVILRNDGTVAHELIGKQYGVEIPNNLAGRLKGLVFTHNHPWGWNEPKGPKSAKGTSLSGPDIHVAVGHELAEMRAVSPGWRHSLRIPPGWHDRAFKEWFDKQDGATKNLVRSEQGQDPLYRGRLLYREVVQPVYDKINQEIRGKYQDQIWKLGDTPEAHALVDHAMSEDKHEINTQLARHFGWHYTREEHRPWTTQTASPPSSPASATSVTSAATSRTATGAPAGRSPRGSRTRSGSAATTTASPTPEITGYSLSRSDQDLKADLYLALFNASHGLDRYGLSPQSTATSSNSKPQPVAARPPREHPRTNAWGGTPSPAPAVAPSPASHESYDQENSAATLPPPRSAVLPPRHRAMHQQLLAKGWHRTPEEDRMFSALNRRIDELEDAGQVPEDYSLEGEGRISPQDPRVTAPVTNLQEGTKPAQVILSPPAPRPQGPWERWRAKYFRGPRDRQPYLQLGVHAAADLQTDPHPGPEQHAQRFADTLLARYQLVHDQYATRGLDDWADEMEAAPREDVNLKPRERRDLRANMKQVQGAFGDFSTIPEEQEGKTVRKNTDFDRELAPGTTCPRQDQYVAHVNALQHHLGRLLGREERFHVGQLMQSYGAQPACWYCYGQSARDKAADLIQKGHTVFHEVARAHQTGEHDQLLDLAKQHQGTQEGRVAKKRLRELYGEAPDETLQSGKTRAWSPGTKFAQYIRAHGNSPEHRAVWSDLPRLHDLALGYQEPRTEPERLATEKIRTILSASQVPTPQEWNTYREDVLKMKPEDLRHYNLRAGLRLNSHTDFRPWHTLELAQMMTHLHGRRAMSHVYTRDPAMLDIFGNTGLKFNLSIGYARGPDGKVMRDPTTGEPVHDMLGLDRPTAKRLRAQYPRNAGTILMPTSDHELETGLDDPEVDMLIPYHAGSVAPAVGRHQGAKDYKLGQHEDWRGFVPQGRRTFHEGRKTFRAPYRRVETLDGRTLDIRKGQNLTREHHRDNKDIYLDLCDKLGIKPKFADVKLEDGRPVTDHDQYMKLVRDVARRPMYHQVVDPRKINWEAARNHVDQYVKQGGHQRDVTPNPAVLQMLKQDIEAGALEWMRQHPHAPGALPLANAEQQPPVPVEVLKRKPWRAKMPRRYSQQANQPAADPYGQFRELMSLAAELDRYKANESPGQQHLFAKHDVTDEPRDPTGQWTTGSPHDTRATTTVATGEDRQDTGQHEPERSAESNAGLPSNREEEPNRETPAPGSNEDLVARFQQGDRQAGDQLIEQNRRFIYGIARRYIKNPSDLEDMFQEGAIAMVQMARSFDPGRGTRFTTPAQVAIERHLAQVVGKQARRRGVWSQQAEDQEHQPLHEPEAAPVPDPVEATERAQGIRAAIEQLPNPRHRLAIQMYYGIDQEPRTQEEIAAEFGVKKQRVSALLASLLPRIEQQVASYYAQQRVNDAFLERYAATFDPEKHPRGQPENQGEFSASNQNLKAMIKDHDQRGLSNTERKPEVEAAGMNWKAYKRARYGGTTPRQQPQITPEHDTPDADVPLTVDATNWRDHVNDALVATSAEDGGVYGPDYPPEYRETAHAWQARPNDEQAREIWETAWQDHKENPDDSPTLHHSLKAAAGLFHARDWDREYDERSREAIEREDREAMEREERQHNPEHIGRSLEASAKDAHEYLTSGMADRREQAAARASIQAHEAHQHLLERGWVPEYMSDSGSTYYRKGNARFRVADHDVPATEERMHNRQQGGFSWADAANQLILPVHDVASELESMEMPDENDETNDADQYGQARVTAAVLDRYAQVTGNRPDFEPDSDRIFANCRSSVAQRITEPPLTASDKTEATKIVSDTVAKPDPNRTQTGLRTGPVVDHYNQIREPHTETPEFKEWFGDSKVRHPKTGKPLVVYHGTDAPEDFDAFENTNDIGYHFGTAPQASARIGASPKAIRDTLRNGGPFDYQQHRRVIPAHLSIQNPLTTPDLDDFHPKAIAMAMRDQGIQVTPPESAMTNRQAFRDWLTSIGYDGIRYRNNFEANTQAGKGGRWSYIAFHPGQIKSATGNRGTYSKADPRINYTQAFHDAFVERYGFLSTVGAGLQALGERIGGQPTPPPVQLPATPPRPSQSADPAVVQAQLVNPGPTAQPARRGPYVDHLTLKYQSTPAITHAREVLAALHNSAALHAKADPVADQAAKIEIGHGRRDTKAYNDAYARHIEPARAQVHQQLSGQLPEILKASDQEIQRQVELHRQAQHYRASRAAQLPNHPEGTPQHDWLIRHLAEVDQTLAAHRDQIREAHQEIQGRRTNIPPPASWTNPRLAREQTKQEIQDTKQRLGWLSRNKVPLPQGFGPDPVENMRDPAFRQAVKELHLQEYQRAQQAPAQTPKSATAKPAAPATPQTPEQLLTRANELVRSLHDPAHRTMLADQLALRMANEAVTAAGGKPFRNVAQARKYPAYATYAKRAQVQAHERIDQLAGQAIERAAEAVGEDHPEIEQLRQAHAGALAIKPRETGLEAAMPTIRSETGEELSTRNLAAQQAARTRKANAKAKAQRVEVINAPEVPHPSDLPRHQEELPDEMRKFGWRPPATVSPAQHLLIQNLYGLHGTPQRSFHDLVNETVRRQTGVGRDGPVKPEDQQKVAHQIAEQVRDAIGKTRTASAAAAYKMDPREYDKTASENLSEQISQAMAHNEIFDSLNSAKTQSQIDAGDDQKKVLRDFDRLAYQRLRDANVAGVTEDNAMQKALEILQRGRVPVPGPHADEWHQTVYNKLGPPPEPEEEPPPEPEDKPMTFTASRHPGTFADLYSALFWATIERSSGTAV